MAVQALEPYLNTREDSVFRFFGQPTVLRSTGETTNGAFCLTESWSMPPGFDSPYHTHHHEDEAFYVLEGEMAFVCDGKWMRGGPGTWVFGPRDIAHGFKVVGNTLARMLLLCAPAGFENFILGLAVPFNDLTPPDMAKVMQLAAKHHIDIHGPLPEDTWQSEASATPITLSPTDLKALNHRWIDAFNQRDWATERAIRAADFQANLSGNPQPLDNDGWSGFMLHFTTAFPDAHIAIESSVAEADTVISRWTLTGTHKDVFQGIPPSGRAIRFEGIESNRVINGQIAEHICQFDLVSLMKQIGAMPA